MCAKNFLMLTVTISIGLSPFSLQRHTHFVTLSPSHAGTPASHGTPLESRHQQVNSGEKENSAGWKGEKWGKGQWRTWTTAVKSGRRKQKYHFWICQLWGTCVVFMVCALNSCFFTFYVRCLHKRGRFGIYLTVNVSAAWHAWFRNFRKSWNFQKAQRQTVCLTWWLFTLKLCFKYLLTISFQGLRGGVSV